MYKISKFQRTDTHIAQNDIFSWIFNNILLIYVIRKFERKNNIEKRQENCFSRNVKFF